MEARLYFSAFVLIMCAVHLVWTGSAWVSTWWEINVPLSHKQTAIVKNCDGKFTKAQTPQRSDWYVFFHCSDLIGRGPVISKPTSIDHNKMVSDRKNRRERRANA